MDANNIGVIFDYSIYVPSSKTHFMFSKDLHPDYIDLYDVSTLEPNNTYNYIRVFYDRPGIIEERTLDTTGQVGNIELNQYNTSSDFFARTDAFNICGCTFLLMCLLVWVFNCVTELFNKGGLFS